MQPWVPLVLQKESNEERDRGNEGREVGLALGQGLSKLFTGQMQPDVSFYKQNVIGTHCVMYQLGYFPTIIEAIWSAESKLFTLVFHLKS